MNARPPHGPAPRRRLLLAAALALAVPAHLLVNASFRPFEARLRLEGREAHESFRLAAAEPLFLEFELLLRGPAEPEVGVELLLNGTPLGLVRPERLYATHRDKRLIPAAALRAGENRLTARLAGGPATFDIHARLHNYAGISPRFPFGVVVADESVRLAVAREPAGFRALRFGALYAASLLLLSAVLRLARRRGAAGLALLASASIVPWCGVAYGLATPLQLWLSAPAFACVSLGPLLLTGFGLWGAARRARLAQAAGLALVTLLVAEAGLRAFNHVRPTYVFYTGSYDRYRGEPGAPIFDFRMNSRGFHDAEHRTSRPPDVYRVVAIGDSFAVGVVPYAANYLTLLESELSPGPRFEVINMGIAAAQPRDYLAILVGEGLAYDPDLVLVGFFVGNDFEAVRRKPYEYSYVATLFRFLWRLARAGPPPAATPTARSAGRYDDTAPSMSGDRFLEIEVDRSWLYRRPGRELAAAAPRAVADVRRMRDVSRRAGAQLLVVIIPDELQLDAQLQEQVARASRSSLDQFEFRLPNQVLAEALAREGIPFLDLLPAFEEAGAKVRLYKPRDTHWNLAGNRLAAVRIADALRERVLSRLNGSPGTGP